MSTENEKRAPFYEVRIRYVQDNKRQEDRVIFETMAGATRYALDQALILRDFYNAKRSKNRTIDTLVPEHRNTGILVKHKISRGYNVTVYLRNRT